MPQLEGDSGSSEMVRVYSQFRLSPIEADSQEVISRHIRRGVFEICFKCGMASYYVVGLERAWLEVESRPPYGLSRGYTLILGLYIRSLVMKLSREDLYYYANTSSDRTLFEMTQLVRCSDTQS